MAEVVVMGKPTQETDLMVERYDGKMLPRLTTGPLHMSQQALMVYTHSQVVMSMRMYVPLYFRALHRV